LILEGDRYGLIGQCGHALREVNDGEQYGEASGFGGLEQMQVFFPDIHIRLMCIYFMSGAGLHAFSVHCKETIEKYATDRLVRIIA